MTKKVFENSIFLVSIFSPAESHTTNIQVGQRLTQISLGLIFSGESEEEEKKILSCQ